MRKPWADMLRTIKLDGKLALVEWVDSTMVHGWTTDPPGEKSQTCFSVGWVMQTSAQSVTLAPHVTIEEKVQRGGEMTIPKCSIVRIEYLKGD